MSGVTSTALVAEPSPVIRAALEAILEAAGWQVIARSALEEARKDISERAPAVVVTSLKLGSFNGVHLVYLAKLANPLALCVVYGEPDRAEEAQRAGAIYVEQNCIREALPDIVTRSVFGEERRVARWKETLPNGVSYETLDLNPNSFEDNTSVYEVPPGHYFMMGDNRDNSTDSRVLGAVGYVPFENLIGRAEIIFFSVEEGERAWTFWRWPWSVRFDRIFKFL